MNWFGIIFLSLVGLTFLVMFYYMIKGAFGPPRRDEKFWW